VLRIVGHNPYPLAKVGRADIGSSQHSPSRIKPHGGQVSKDGAESARSENWRVFHEDVTGSYFTDDSRHFQPEAGSLAADAGAFSGGADVLAGKAARYHVNMSAPWPSVKGANVIPNRERREKAVILPGAQYACGIGIVFDGADGAPSKEVAAEYAASSACE
jgi:hypothetical protein